MKAEEILPVLLLQLSNNFGLSEEEIKIVSQQHICGEGYKCTVECFAKSTCKYFKKENGLNAFNSVMYTNYLYQVSHLLYKGGYTQIADKVYYLNKMLNGVDLFYAVELPKHWNCEHPLGSVMGRAQYGDYFFFYQGCTIGGNHTDYPVLGDHVTMYSNSKVLGKCFIGSNVVIGANAYVKDSDIPDNSMVFGQFPNLIIKPNKNIDVMWKNNDLKPLECYNESMNITKDVLKKSTKVIGGGCKCIVICKIFSPSRKFDKSNKVKILIKSHFLSRKYSIKNQVLKLIC